MSGWYPPNLAMLDVGIATGAANAYTSGQILAAPGVGFRFRVWAAFVGPNNTAQAVIAWNWQLTDFPVAVAFGRIAQPNFASGTIYWPGGFAIPQNTALGYQVQSALANLGLTVMVAYTTEAV